VASVRPSSSQLRKRAPPLPVSTNNQPAEPAGATERKDMTKGTQSLIKTLIETSTTGLSYTVTVKSITRISQNISIVIYDCASKPGRNLSPIRRVAQVDTKDCRIPWDMIASNADMAWEPNHVSRIC
jgi:hypothetical protein